VMPFALWLDGLSHRRELVEQLERNEVLEEHLDKRWRTFLLNLFAGLTGGVVVLTVGIALAAVIQRHRQTRRLRRQISADLHDDIGSKVAAISLASADVEHNASEERIRERGAQIRTISANMHQGLRDVLWVTDTETDLLDQLVRKLADIARLNISSRRLELKIPPLGSLPKRKINVRIKRDLLLFFKEALHNAAVHSAAGTIRVEIRVEGRVLLMRIEDDGKGFDMNAGAELTEHHGLTTMRERAGRMHAKVCIESASGKGTAVELCLNT
jgi:signal transduction histidine kinase